MEQRKQLEELILMHCCNNPNKEIDRMAHIKIDELMDDLLSKFKLLTIPVVVQRSKLLSCETCKFNCDVWDDNHPCAGFEFWEAT